LALRRSSSNGAEADILATGEDLKALILKIRRCRQILDRIGRRLDARVVDAVVRATTLSRGDLDNPDRLVALGEELGAWLSEHAPDAAPVVSKVVEDEAHGHALLVRTRLSGSDRFSRLDFELLTSGDFQDLRALTEELADVRQGPFRLGDEDAADLEDLEAVAEAVMAFGRKGLSIQRYKGLGEMNPEQLWDTTMNPDTRTLLQVQPGDEVTTDKIFEVLMGDDVEQRRRFIEDHALEVKHLDV